MKRESIGTISVLALFIAGILLLTLKGRARIVRYGKTFVGQTELRGNSGFTSSQLEKMMANMGWKSGDAWCVYLAKLIWYDMAPPLIKPLVKKLVSGNSQDTFKKLSEDSSGAFRVTMIPHPGDMVIWQYYDNGKPQWRGHAGIVTAVHVNNFETVEGNTNISGGSEGYIVGEKIRGYDFDKTQGLRLKGFITFA